MGVPKRILIVAPFAPSFVAFRGALIGELVARGHTVIAAAPQIDACASRNLRKLGAHPVEIPLQNAGLNPISLLRSLRAVKRLIRRENPNLVIGYAIKPVIVSAFAARSERVDKVVSVITGLGYAFTGGREIKRLASRAAASVLYWIAFKSSDLVIFLNLDDQRLFEQLRLLPKGRESRILNGEGIDVAEFSPARLPRATAFLMIARLLKDKGVREFADAARRLKAVHPEVSVCLVGPFYPSPDTIRQNELDQLIRSGIEYKGALDDVRPEIANCSVYVLPSYREGTPRSVLEAMAMGRAIITTDVPGCRETVVDGVNGLLVRPRDVDSLYEAMMRFVEDPSLARAMGHASRRMAETKYDIRHVNADFIRYTKL